MNHKKIKKQINKINAFFESITADDEVSKIEKDLLLSYVSKLYESILVNDASVIAAPRIEAKQSNPIPVAVKKVEEAIIPERKPFERAEVAQPVVQETKAEAPIQEKVVQEAIVEKAPIITKVVVKPAAPVEEESINVDLSENMLSIFERSGGTEISDKLGSLPIKDLTKSMGINERMFTITELFGGNQDKFKSVMSHLNKLNGFDEAKEYLINGIATELEWDSDVKYKKADKFVKLVQRRFS